MLIAVIAAVVAVSGCSVTARSGATYGSGAVIDGFTLGVPLQCSGPVGPVTSAAIGRGCGGDPQRAMAALDARDPGHAAIVSTTSWTDGTQPGAIDEHTEMLAAVFAAHAAVALINVQDLGNLRAMAASRDLIGQAKGILMARNNTTADEAFAALVHASQHSNRKLRDICSYLITHGSIDSLGSA